MNKKGSKKALLADNTFSLLGAFIIAMIILSTFEMLSRVKFEETEKFGDGVLLISKEGEKFINYTLYEKGFFGRAIEKQIVMKFNEDLSDGLSELSMIKNAIGRDNFSSEDSMPKEIKVAEVDGENIGSVLSLWTNGHPIQAITGFKAMFYSPSSDYLPFSREKKWDSEIYGRFSDTKEFREFSEILIYGNVDSLWEFAKSNNCSFLFLSEADLYELPYLFSYVNGKYLNKDGDILLQEIKNSLLYQLLLEKELKKGCDNSRFDLIYSDSNSRIFRVC